MLVFSRQQEGSFPPQVQSSHNPNFSLSSLSSQCRPQRPGLALVRVRLYCLEQRNSKYKVPGTLDLKQQIHEDNRQS